MTANDYSNYFHSNRLLDLNGRRMAYPLLCLHRFVGVRIKGDSLARSQKTALQLPGSPKMSMCRLYKTHDMKPGIQRIKHDSRPLMIPSPAKQPLESAGLGVHPSLKSLCVPFFGGITMKRLVQFLSGELQSWVSIRRELHMNTLEFYVQLTPERKCPCNEVVAVSLQSKKI